jgi:hypothetical protein
MPEQILRCKSRRRVLPLTRHPRVPRPVIRPYMHMRVYHRLFASIL